MVLLVYTHDILYHVTQSTGLACTYMVHTYIVMWCGTPTCRCAHTSTYGHLSCQRKKVKRYKCSFVSARLPSTFMYVCLDRYMYYVEVVHVCMSK